MKRILVAIDGSLFAKRALQLGCQLACDTNAELIIMSVNQRVKDSELDEFAHIEHVTIGEIADQNSSAILAQARDDTIAFGVREVKTISRDGDVAGAMLKLAKDLPADLVVMGKR
jgi:nucleotide-binding universal stress UspA family protein